MTMCVSGRRRWMSSMISIARMSPSGSRENLYAPWLVPIATASASTPVRSTNSSAWAGSVRQISPEPTPSSMPPSVPSSPSTVTPRACAYSTTFFVTATLSSKLSGVLASSPSEPSIITLVKPSSMALMHVSGELPWSWCSATGMSGYVSAAASIMW